MPTARSGSANAQIRSLFGGGSLAGLGEHQLLDRFVAERDEAAFEALMNCHGPMVLGVCRRVLDDPSDVEDAFQATFLVLVRKAASIRDRDRLANWLYGVAHRVSVRARAVGFRRRCRERPGAEAASIAAGASSDDRAELRAVLDDEIARLPDRFRLPMVLCDLQGLPMEEAARRLDCPVGTIKSRLSRARGRLRGRLERRGIVAPAIPPVDAGSLAGPLPAALKSLTLRSAIEIAAGSTAKTPAVALARDVLRSMSMPKILAAGLAPLALGLAAYAGTLAIAPLQSGLAPPPMAAPRLDPLPDRLTVRDALKGWWDGIETLEFRDVSCDTDPDGRPVMAGRRQFVEVALGRDNRRVVVHGLLDAEGRVGIAQEKRENGRSQFYLLGDTKVPVRFHDATFRDQENTRDVFVGETGTLIWLLTPMGDGVKGCRPLHLHIDSGARLEVGRDFNDRPTVTLIVEHGTIHRYELDPDHGYLPRRMSGAFQDVTVTRFARDNGRWFPVEGLLTHHQPGMADRKGAFVVTGLAINRPIADARFELPPNLDDTQVIDLRKGRNPAPVDR